MRSSGPRFLALCVALVGGLGAAQPTALARSGLALEWRAPDECPTAQTVQSMVADFLGGDPRSAREIGARAIVERDAQNLYRLVLRIDNAGQHSERSLSDADCATLAQASALLIAIAIDPEVEARLALQPVAPQVGPPSTPPQPAAPPPAAAPPPEASEPAEESGSALVPRLGAELGGVLDAGMLHGAGFGFGGALTLRLDILRFALGGQWLLPRSFDIGALDSARAHLHGADAMARACVVWNVSRFDLGPCAVFELGSIWADASGIRDPEGGHALWIAFGGGLQARWHFVPAWSLFAGGALLAPHQRRRFYVDADAGQVAVHQVPAVIGRVGLGIAYEVE